MVKKILNLFNENNRFKNIFLSLLFLCFLLFCSGYAYPQFYSSRGINNNSYYQYISDKTLLEIVNNEYLCDTYQYYSNGELITPDDIKELDLYRYRISKVSERDIIILEEVYTKQEYEEMLQNSNRITNVLVAFIAIAGLSFIVFIVRQYK